MDLLLTTVCRTAPPSSVHGQIIRCNTSQGKCEVVVELKGQFCNANPRGGDRGFRGIAFDAQNSHYLVTAANEVHLFDADFQSIGTIQHPSFRHLHNITISQRTAFIVSTGADRIIELNLDDLKISNSWGLKYITSDQAIESEKNPPKPEGPWVHHFNALQTFNGGFFVSGARSGTIFKVANSRATPVQKLPVGAHDILIQEHQLTFLNTASDCITTLLPNGQVKNAPVNQRSLTVDTGTSRNSQLHARPDFLRGMCALPELDATVFGSSPTSVGFYDLKNHTIDKMIQISRDVRWMVSGICVLSENL